VPRVFTPLEWPDDFARDPSAIEFTRLRPHRLAVNEACRPGRIERKITRDCLKLRGRTRIAPADRLGHNPNDFLISSIGDALPFANRRAQVSLQEIKANGVRRYVKCGRTCGLQNPVVLAGISNDQISQADFDAPLIDNDCRRPRIIPDRFLRATRPLSLLAH
jgi:hypothetical protein